MPKYSSLFFSILLATLMSLGFVWEAAAVAKGVKVRSNPSVNEPAGSRKTSSAQSLFGVWKLGLSASVGLPFLVNFGLDAIWRRSFGFAISGGYIDSVFEGSRKVTLSNWDVRTRWFPWEGSFFMGAAYGNQSILVKMSHSSTTEAGSIVHTTMMHGFKSTYVTPHFGWFTTWSSGFSLGFELGYQVPMNSKAEEKLDLPEVVAHSEAELKDSAEYKRVKESFESIANPLGRKAVPYVTILRVGWML